MFEYKINKFVNAAGNTVSCSRVLRTDMTIEQLIYFALGGKSEKLPSIWIDGMQYQLRDIGGGAITVEREGQLFSIELTTSYPCYLPI